MVEQLGKNVRSCCAVYPVHSESHFRKYKWMPCVYIVVHTAQVGFGSEFCFSIFANT